MKNFFKKLIYLNKTSQAILELQKNERFFFKSINNKKNEFSKKIFKATTMTHFLRKKKNDSEINDESTGENFQTIYNPLNIFYTNLIIIKSWRRYAIEFNEFSKFHKQQKNFSELKENFSINILDDEDFE